MRIARLYGLIALFGSSIGGCSKNFCIWFWDFPDTKAGRVSQNDLSILMADEPVCIPLDPNQSPEEVKKTCEELKEKLALIEIQECALMSASTIPLAPLQCDGDVDMANKFLEGFNRFFEEYRNRITEDYRSSHRRFWEKVRELPNATTLDNYQGPSMCLCIGKTVPLCILKHNASGFSFAKITLQSNLEYAFSGCASMQESQRSCLEFVYDRIPLKQTMVQFLLTKLLLPTAEDNVNRDDINMNVHSLIKGRDGLDIASYDDTIRPAAIALLPWQQAFVWVYKLRDSDEYVLVRNLGLRISEDGKFSRILEYVTIDVNGDFQRAESKEESAASYRAHSEIIAGRMSTI